MAVNAVDSLSEITVLVTHVVWLDLGVTFARASGKAGEPLVALQVPGEFKVMCPKSP